MYQLATDFQTLLEHHRRNPDDVEIMEMLLRVYIEWMEANDHPG
jgi:hypothetical protein